MGQADHPLRLTVFALVGAALVAAAWFLVNGDDGPPAWGHVDPEWVEQAEAPEAEAMQAVTPNVTAARTEIAAPATLPDGGALLTVSGRVMDTEARPVAGAEVSVMQLEIFDVGSFFSRGGKQRGGY